MIYIIHAIRQLFLIITVCKIYNKLLRKYKVNLFHLCYHLTLFTNHWSSSFVIYIILEDLRWFCWDRCPLKCLPCEFYPRKVVILELPHSQMKTVWEKNKVSTMDMLLAYMIIHITMSHVTSPNCTPFYKNQLFLQN